MQHVATAMADHLVDRGPDGRGRWVDGDAGVALAHTRLAILDLSEAGDQPMLSADGRWVVALNGEIYNHRQLARRLESAGVRFRGHSDTEVLVEAIARWGMEVALERIDGMFALAVWDRNERRLSLARDRLGEKPLCWAELPGGGLAFGSTVDAVTAHPDVDVRISRQALTAYLRHKAVPDPASIVEGVHKLPPAHLLSWRSGESPRIIRYWTPPRSGHGTDGPADDRSDAQLVAETTGLLKQAVADRLVADVGVGVFLSGGVDRSGAMTVASRESGSVIGSAPSGDSPARIKSTWLRCGRVSPRKKAGAAARWRAMNTNPLSSETIPTTATAPIPPMVTLAPSPSTRYAGSR